MKKSLFNRVAIVGVGLIGGSLGFAIKKRKLAKFVVGVARRKKSAIAAVKAKAVDMVTLNLKEGVQGAELVILAGPIPTIIEQIKTLPKFINKNRMVIDVGSSKTQINKTAKKFLGKNFVGCHPMAGSETCGIEYADENLFEGAICFVTQKNPKIEAFWKALGAKPILVKDSLHDAWVAKSSHLPHALSFALLQKISNKYPFNPSLKDMARLARSHPELWADIFLSNQIQVLKASRVFQKDLSRFQKALQQKNRVALVRFIQRANRVAR